MAKPINITMPDPCLQPWEDMHANAVGAFCDKCAFQVIDFTGKSDSEVYDILTKSRGHKICGRFGDYQLNRSLVKTEVKKSFLGWKTLVASLAALVAGKSLSAKEPPVFNAKATTFQMADTAAYRKPPSALDSVDTVAKKMITIRGKVFGRLLRLGAFDRGPRGNPLKLLPKARVYTSDSAYSTTTDMFGYFKLQVSENTKLVIVIEHEEGGYHSQHLSLGEFLKEKKPKKIVMQNYFLMGCPHF